MPQIWGEIGFSVDENADGPAQHQGVATPADAARQLTAAYDLAAQYDVGAFNVYAAYATTDRSVGMSLLQADGIPYPHARELAEHVRQARAATTPSSSQPVAPRSYSQPLTARDRPGVPSGTPPASTSTSPIRLGR